MGLISSAVNGALEAMGEGMMGAGGGFLKGGYSVWRAFSEITVSYVQKEPESFGAWSMVTGSIYTLSMAVAAALVVVVFLIGWVRDSIDIRNNLNFDSMFKFFIRYILTAGLIVNSLALISSISQCATAVVATVGQTEMHQDAPDDMFEDAKEKMEDEDADGLDWFITGIIAIAGGFLGGLVIIVCAVQLVLAVLSRLFKMFLCIPFAPVALSGFAGGREFSQSGIAWLRTFTGYALEAVVIVLAIAISMSLFADGGLFQPDGEESYQIAMILQICGYCMPMLAACASVKGAEMVVRRCLGLG